MITKVLFHTVVHLLPLIVLFFIFKKYSKFDYKIIIVFLLFSFIIDLDHLLAIPIYDPLRCSIGFHPLHKPFAMIVYFIGLFYNKTRIISSGIIAHLIVDGIDCMI